MDIGKENGVTHHHKGRPIVRIGEVSVVLVEGRIGQKEGKF